MNPNTTQNPLTPDQHLVFEELAEMLEMMREITRGEEELEIGDATDIAIALGRAQRLSAHLGEEHPTTVSYAAQLQEGLNLFTQREEWGEAVILETDFTPMVEALVEALAEPDMTGLELMRLMIEVDRLLSALHLLSGDHHHELSATMIQRVDLAIAARPEGAAKLSERAQRFIESQGPRESWGAVWREVTLAQERLADLKALEAELDEESLTHPLPQIDLFAGLDDSADEASSHRLSDWWAEIRRFAEHNAALVAETVDALIISLDRPLKLHARAANTLGDRVPTGERILHTAQHQGVTFEYYLTFEESGLVSFNVEASHPVSMRLKANGEVIRPGVDALSLSLPLYQELDQQNIEHYVGDTCVWSLS